MYRTTLHTYPSSATLSEIEHARRLADKSGMANKAAPQVSHTEPMVFVRLLLVVGMVIAAAAVAASLS